MGQPSAVYQVAEAAEQGKTPNRLCLKKVTRSSTWAMTLTSKDSRLCEGVLRTSDRACRNLQQLQVLCEQRMPEQVPRYGLCSSAGEPQHEDHGASPVSGECPRFLLPGAVRRKEKRKPKQTTCKLFFAKIVSMMEWNPDYRYKLLGKLIHANRQYMIAFDLTATEVYQRTFPREGAKPKTSRTPVFPAGWQDQFSLPTKSISSPCRSTSLLVCDIFHQGHFCPRWEPKNTAQNTPCSRLRWSSHPRRCSP